MTAIVTFNSVRMIEADYHSDLRDRTTDLSIKRDCLQRIKTIFRHFRIQDGPTQLERVVNEIKIRYGYSHAIFLYESSTFPHEIILFRSPESANEGAVFEVDSTDSIRSDNSAQGDEEESAELPEFIDPWGHI